MNRFTDREKLFIASFVVFMAVCIAYAWTLSFEFVYDDFVVAGQNEFITDWQNLGKFLSYDYYLGAQENTYRPVTTLTYFLDYSIWGPHPFGFNFTGMLLHMVSGILMLLFALRMLKGNLTAALLSALVFVLHPVCTEAVLSEGNREEALSVVFYLAAILLYLKGRDAEGREGFAAVSFLVYLVGLFAMEMTVTLPAVLFLLEWMHSEESGVHRFSVCLKKTLPFFFLAALFLAGRFTIWTGSRSEVELLGDRLHVLLTMPLVMLEYIRLLFLPVNLKVIYDIPLVSSFTDIRFWLPLALFVSFTVLSFGLAWRKKIAGFSGLWFLIVLLPVSQVVIPFWILISERYLYLVLPGFAVGVGAVAIWVFSKLQGRAQRVTMLLFGILPLVLFTGTMSRAFDWKTSLRLWRDNVNQAPGAADSRYNLAMSLWKKGDMEEAYKYFKKNADESAKEQTAFLNMAAILRAKGEYRQADFCLEEVLRRNPDHGRAFLERGRILLEQGLYAEARENLAQAVMLDPLNPDAHSSLAGAALFAGDNIQAHRAAMAALKLNEEHAVSHQVLAHLAVLAGDRELAVKEYAKLFRYADTPMLEASAIYNIRKLARKSKP